MQNVIEVENLVVRYGQKTVLDGINTHFPAGEIRVILGASGCGKTTFLKTLIGLLQPAQGTIRIFGNQLGDFDAAPTMDLLKQIGVLFQNGALLGSLTVADNVALPMRIHTALPESVIREMVAIKLSQVGLSHAANLLPNQLSGGMRKRAGLARALALDPRLLFCDEPSAGLDPVTSAGLDELLLRLRDRLGISIVVVTHELMSIQKIADTITFLHKGRVLFEGPLGEAAKLSSGPVADFFMRNETQPVGAATASALPFLVENVR